MEEQPLIRLEKQLSQRQTYLLLALLLIVLVSLSNLLLIVIKAVEPQVIPSIAFCAVSLIFFFIAVKPKGSFFFNLINSNCSLKLTLIIIDVK